MVGGGLRFAVNPLEGWGFSVGGGVLFGDGARFALGRIGVDAATVDVVATLSGSFDVLVLRAELGVDATLVRFWGAGDRGSGLAPAPQTGLALGPLARGVIGVVLEHTVLLELGVAVGWMPVEAVATVNGQPLVALSGASGRLSVGVAWIP